MASARADFLYVSTTDNHIAVIDTVTHNKTIFASSGLSQPHGLGFDALGNLYKEVSPGVLGSLGAGGPATGSDLGRTGSTRPGRRAVRTRTGRRAV